MHKLIKILFIPFLISVQSLSGAITMTIDDITDIGADTATLHYTTTIDAEGWVLQPKVAIDTSPNPPVWPADPLGAVQGPEEYVYFYAADLSPSFTLTVTQSWDGGSTAPSLMPNTTYYVYLQAYDFTAAEWGTTTETSFTTVPEPGTYALVLGALAFGGILWRRRLQAGHL